MMGLGAAAKKPNQVFMLDIPSSCTQPDGQKARSN